MYGRQKGITPVVAIILLLMIVISLIGGFMLWFGQVSELLQRRGEERLNVTIGAMEKTIVVENVVTDGATYVNITIRNTGSIDISSRELGIYVDGNAVNCDEQDIIRVGSIWTCDVTVAGGCTTEVRVTSPGTPEGDTRKC
jgi:flagellin-like protein